MTDPDRPAPPAERWLLLIHQLPAKPAYLRVKIWRRLQGIGAVAVKNAVYALPGDAEAQEDFEWLLREIVAGRRRGDRLRGPARRGPHRPGGRALFDRARDDDYEELAKEVARPCRGARRRSAAGAARGGEGAARAAARTRLAQVAAIDFFGADGREAAEGLLAELEGRARARRPRESRAAARTPRPRRAQGPDLGDAHGRPRRPHRLGLADPPLHRPGGPLQVRARQGLRPRARRAPLRHVRGRVHPRGRPLHLRGAARRALGLDEPALRAIAEIVHDIDLKDGKFGRARGRRDQDPDRRHLRGDRRRRGAPRRGGAVFEDLYAHFRRRRR